MQKTKVIQTLGNKMLSLILLSITAALTFAGVLTLADAAILDGDHMQDASGADSTVTNQVIRKGWGVIQGNGTRAIESAPVNYGITFDELPFLLVKFSNSRLVAEEDPANLAECTVTRRVIGAGVNQTVDGFKPILRTPDGLDMPNTINYCYTWMAIGRHDASYDGETDPVYAASAAAGIAAGEITNWNTAYGWGDHSTAGYLTSYTETDPIFSGSDAAGIAAADITNWNTAFGWGDHSAAGYLTSYTETDPEVGSNSLNYVPKWDGSSLISGSIYDNGKIGIGNNSPLDPLAVAGSGGSNPAIAVGNTSFNNVESGRLKFDEIVDDAGGTCGFEFHNNGAQDRLYLNTGCNIPTAGVTAMAVDRSSGYFKFLQRALVGGNDASKLPTADLHIKQSNDSFPDPTTGGIKFEMNGSTNDWQVWHSNPFLSFAYNGIRVSYINTGGTFVTTSDFRAKKEIKDIDSDVLERILQLNPVEFKYNHQGENDKTNIGFVAQDVQKIFPELIHSEDGDNLALAYSDFSVLAIEAIQELKAQKDSEIENLQEKINQLNNENEQIKTILCEMYPELNICGN